MPRLQNLPVPSPSPEDTALIDRAASGDASAIRQIIKTNNQRLYRLVRAVVPSNSDAEDVLQEAYLQAFAKIGSFNGEASLSTWLSRIALNAAFMRLRAQKRLKRMAPVAGLAQAEIIPFPLPSPADDPERLMAQRQLLQLVEEATDGLAEPFRLVFVARVIEGLSVEETAALLDLPQATVKSRLHRARKLIRNRLEEQIGPVFIDAFPFAGVRCDRLTDAVITKLGLQK